MKKAIKRFFQKIGYIIHTIIGGGVCAIIPAGVMYAAHQTTASYIKKYEAGSSKLETALEMTKKVDIVCGIILGGIAIWMLYNIIKCIIGKVDLDEYYKEVGTGSSYSGSYSNNNAEQKPQFGYSTSYIKDQFGNVVGKETTTTYSDKYGSFGTTEYKDNFGNVIGKKDTY